MATFREMIYMCLDLLKTTSDDSFYTEDHVKFLLKRVRAALLEQKYKETRNSVYQSVSSENTQQVCLTVSPAASLVGDCGGKWLRSDAVVPQFLFENGGVACTGHDLQDTVVTFIPRERMRYVGHNPWLRNIVYAARSADGHLYLRGTNPQFVFLSLVGLTGVFSDPEEAAALSHEAVSTGVCPDILDQVFPLEGDLISSCVETVVQELSGVKFQPKDFRNDAADDLSKMGTAASQNRQQQREAEQ